MARQFGVGQRDAMRAASVLLNDSREAGERGFSTVATTLNRFENFRDFMREQGLSRLDKVTPEMVKEYAQSLKESGLAASTQQNYLSAVNSVLSLGHERQGTRWETVSGRAEGLDARSNVRTEQTATREQLREAQGHMPERAAAVAELARELGLRSKEASLLDARGALKEAEARGAVRIEDGTKGGRAREVPITDQRQIEALKNAAAVQADGRNLIPEGQTWAQFRAGDLQEGREAMREAGAGTYHDQRAAYAADRYEQITGHLAPCNSGGARGADKESDAAAREVISAELGHGRIDVLVSYVGSSR